ncbi:MAG TPA: response regulator [Anaerolineae bacterium]|nr:response regulator [Anaerolineae bacterium]
MKNQKPLTTGQVAAYCHVSHVTVLKWIKEGRLKAYTIPSGHYRIQKPDFHEFLVQHKMPIDEAFFAEEAVKVLVVDDDAKTYELIASALDEYEFASATNGFEAGLRLANFQPGLLILNLDMAGIDALEVCQSVKANPATKRTRILVLAKSAEEKAVSEALACGADGYLVKPLKVEELKQKVQGLMGRGR